VDRLFSGGHSRSLVAFPLRLVCLETDETDGDAPAKILVSVPKRCFKRAVKRNRVKRQVREAYRLNKHILDALAPQSEHKQLALAFIWLDDKLRDSEEVHRKVKNLLERTVEKLKPAAGDNAEKAPEMAMKSPKIEGE